MLNYSLTHTFSEDEYVRVQSLYTKKFKYHRVLLAGSVGIVCLFSAYTLLLGIVILLLVLLALFASKYFPSMSRREYRESKIAKHPATYTVTDDVLSFSGPNGLFQSCNWHNHVTWSEKDDWISIYAPGMNQLHFPVSRLKEDGVYDTILLYLRRFGSRQEKKPLPAVPHPAPVALPLQLSSPYLPMTVDASPGVIIEVLSSLPNKPADKFAILSVDQLWFMQTCFTTDGFVLEYQTGSVYDHFSSLRHDLSLEDVTRAFVDYAASEGRTVPNLEFRRIDLRSRWQQMKDFVTLIFRSVFNK